MTMNMDGKCSTSRCGHWLVIIGGINWGLVGLGSLLGGMNLNVVNLLLGNFGVVESIVYLLVGISAVFMLVGCRCKTCTGEVK